MNCQLFRSVLFIGELCLFFVGCDKHATTSTVSFDVTLLHREMSPTGPVLIEGPSKNLIAATISSVTELQSLVKATVQVKAIKQGKASFQIAHADGSNMQAEVTDGQSKEFYENGGAAGVRIHLIRTNP